MVRTLSKRSPKPMPKHRDFADGPWCCRALKPPGYFPDWHVGIRVAETGKLVAFIAGIPMELRVRNAYVSPP